MIRFLCHCTHEFLVPEDQAGGMIQCPLCSRLNDIPTLSDLANLEDGGIFKVGEKPADPNANFLPEAARAFTRAAQDERGDDIDLRATVDEFLAAGTEEVPFEMADEVRPGAPKYDPSSGELIAPIDIKPSDHLSARQASAIPIAKRAVSYARADIAPRISPGTILTQLLQPVNLFVMLFVLVAHGVFQGVLIVVQGGMFIFAPVLFIVGGLILAHYGDVVDETGPTQSDELPRPLRNMGWHDDLWGPFIRFMVAIFFCFWPLMVLPSYMDVTKPAGAGLIVSMGAFGIYFFPAMLLSALTSGTYLNLRPDRVIGVIRACGGTYWASVVAFMVSGAIYLAGIAGADMAVVSLFTSGRMGMSMVYAMGGFTLLLLGIYLFHFACWHLGLLHRANYANFPWILQRHVSSRRTDTIAQLEARRAALRRAAALKAQGVSQTRVGNSQDR